MANVHSGRSYTSSKAHGSIARPHLRAKTSSTVRCFQSAAEAVDSVELPEVTSQKDFRPKRSSTALGNALFSGTSPKHPRTYRRTLYSKYKRTSQAPSGKSPLVEKPRSPVYSFVSPESTVPARSEERTIAQRIASRKKDTTVVLEKKFDNEEESMEDEWEVEAIVGARTVNNAREYLVKWKGDKWDDTWEIEENVQHCQDLVSEYEDKQEQRKMRIEEEKAQEKAMKDLQKKLQNEKYEQKKKEAEVVAEKKRKEAEEKRARKEKEEAAKREERHKEIEAKFDKSKSPTSDIPIQKALKVKTKPLLNPSAESSSSPKRKMGSPPSSRKRKERASTSESSFSLSKSPTPVPTSSIATAAMKPKGSSVTIIFQLNVGSSPALSISPNLKSFPVAAPRRSAMDHNTPVVKILAHKPKELEVKRLEDLDFLIHYAGSPSEFVSYETCLEKIPAHLCEYLAQNGPIFYPSRR